MQAGRPKAIAQQTGIEKASEFGAIFGIAKWILPSSVIAAEEALACFWPMGGNAGLFEFCANARLRRRLNQRASNAKA